MSTRGRRTDRGRASVQCSLTEFCERWRI